MGRLPAARALRCRRATNTSHEPQDRIQSKRPPQQTTLRPSLRLHPGVASANNVLLLDCGSLRPSRLLGARSACNVRKDASSVPRASGAPAHNGEARRRRSCSLLSGVERRAAAPPNPICQQRVASRLMLRCVRAACLGRAPLAMSAKALRPCRALRRRRRRRQRLRIFSGVPSARFAGRSISRHQFP
jgi:hypothetical protein